MRRRTFSREYKIEAVKLVDGTRCVCGASVPRPGRGRERLSSLAEGGGRGAGVCFSR